MDWKILIIGVAVGAAVGFVMGQKAIGGGAGITGGFASPFQSRIDRGA